MSHTSLICLEKLDKNDTKLIKIKMNGCRRMKYERQYFEIWKMC